MGGCDIAIAYFETLWHGSAPNTSLPTRTEQEGLLTQSFSSVERVPGSLHELLVESPPEHEPDGVPYDAKVNPVIVPPAQPQEKVARDAS